MTEEREPTHFLKKVFEGGKGQEIHRNRVMNVMVEDGITAAVMVVLHSKRSLRGRNEAIVEKQHMRAMV